MKTKSYFGIVQNGSIKMCLNRSFEDVVVIAIDNASNIVIERYYDLGNLMKQRIYAWNASLVDGNFLKKIFPEDSDLSDPLKEACKDKNPAFLYLPCNMSVKGDDKRDFLKLDDFADVQILNEAKLLSIAENVWERNDYGYGIHSFLLCSAISLQDVVAKAKQEGYGFVVKYEGKNKRIIIAWDAEVLTYNQALQKFVGDKEALDYVIQHYKSGYNDFVYSNAREKDLFALDFFNGFKSIKA